MRNATSRRIGFKNQGTAISLLRNPRSAGPVVRIRRRERRLARVARDVRHPDVRERPEPEAAPDRGPERQRRREPRRAVRVETQHVPVVIGVGVGVVPAVHGGAELGRARGRRAGGVGRGDGEVGGALVRQLTRVLLALQGAALADLGHGVRRGLARDEVRPRAQRVAVPVTVIRCARGGGSDVGGGRGSERVELVGVDGDERRGEAGVGDRGVRVVGEGGRDDAPVVASLCGLKGRVSG